MTETVEPVMVPVVIEALAIIDRGLGELQQRELVPASEVTNLLLDLRLLLTTADLPVASN